MKNVAKEACELLAALCRSTPVSICPVIWVSYVLKDVPCPISAGKQGVNHCADVTAKNWEEALLCIKQSR